MDTYFALLESGSVIDLVLGFMVLEVAVLLFVIRGRPLGAADVVFHLSAGALLLLALRSALTTGASAQTGIFLLASLPAHLYDLVRRVRRAA